MAYKRGIAVGCSHGLHIDPIAAAAVVRAVDEFKPHVVVHGGDFCDTKALRSGAKGTPDEAEPIQPDIDGGLEFLRAIRATHVCFGNHEARLWHLAASPNAVVSYCAQNIINEIHGTLKELRAKSYPYDGVFQNKLVFGGWKFIHGVVYSRNAIAEHANMYGNVVHWHTHRPGIATGERDDHPIGICPGTLTRRREMAYANTRKATLAWGQAILFFHFSDTNLVPTLCLGPQEGSDGKWFLPV